MENYIKIYEKSNRKRNFVSSIIAFVGAVFCFITFIAIALYDLSVFYILIPAIIFEYNCKESEHYLMLYRIGKEHEWS